MCVGELNIIKLSKEHSGGGRLSTTMRGFLEAIEDLEIKDFLSYEG